MVLSPGSMPGPTFRLQAATGKDDPGVQKAIELGNTARATLGHMPFSGYYAAANEGALLLAYADQQLAGYALYALTRRGVRLTHLCVAEQFRKCGIASMLIDDSARSFCRHL
jgi:ribosomal protein S18 acetylase RimI-like enzyme